MSNEDRCGVGRCDERYTRGCCIATWHRHGISWSNAGRAGVDILTLFLSYFWFCRGGSGRGRSVLLLLLKLGDINHRVRVDFTLRGSPGQSLGSVGVVERCTHPFSICWGTKDTALICSQSCCMMPKQNISLLSFIILKMICKSFQKDRQKVTF